MVGHAQRVCYPPGRIELHAVTLPVPETERMRDVALRMSDRQHRGGIQPTTEQYHRRLPCHHAHLRPIAVTYRMSVLPPQDRRRLTITVNERVARCCSFRVVRWMIGCNCSD